MSFVTRHLLPTILVGVAVVLMVGFFAFARPQYHPPNQGDQGEQIKLPPELPAADASGAAGWVWPVGVPGFEPGQMLGRHHDFNISGVQPIEVAAAQLAAARQLLDADGVRVLVSSRAARNGLLAILAAPVLDGHPARTCVAALLQGDAPVRWRCPNWTRSSLDLDHARVIVAATVYVWPNGMHPLYLVGVARGDVHRVVLELPGVPSREIYTRGNSWGQFESAVTPKHDGGKLLVYDKHGLVETVPIRIKPGTQQVLR
ncbi:MAG TPA: hypothetical protein VGO39_13335 [Gaiellaceae bacterium]|nr:hypothetical protein [Gaiellaceae bacterium]